MADPDPPNDRPQGPGMVREASLILIVGAVAALGATWWLGRPSSRDRSRFAAAAEADREFKGPYIGPGACGECHPVESARFPRSGHARTLRPILGLPLTRRLAGHREVDPEHPDVTWSYDLHDGQFRIRREDAGISEPPTAVHYAFGSGHHATTFVTLLDPAIPTVLEHHLTHYTADDRLRITPGQRAEALAPGSSSRGRKLPPSVMLKCFRCHSTRTSYSGEGISLAELIPNVSCERCHGPARKHVQDARAGKADLRMPMGPGSWTAESQLTLCGQCHRHSSQMIAGEIRPENTALARFQPVGLAQSRCYTQSDGALSCVTCHDPHARTSIDTLGYDKACLQCHESAQSAQCPVSPRGGCVDCHMPKVDSGQNVPFTDHWIRVRREEKAGESR